MKNTTPQLQETELKKADAFFEKGKEAEKKAKYKVAIEQFEKAIPLYKKNKQWDRYLETECQIGKLYRLLSLFDKALPLLLEKSALALQKLGTVHIIVAQFDCEIGNCYRNKGEYEKAIAHFQKSLGICRNILGELHLETSNSYIGLGSCYLFKGAYVQALEYYQKSLNIRLKVLGTFHAETAKSFNDIGVCHFNKGNYNQALAAYQKALDIRLKVLNEGHPDLAQNYNNIGGVHSQKGAYAKGIAWMKKALKINLAMLGELNAETAITYSNIGLLYFHVGAYKQALQYAEKVLEIRLKIFGEFHDATAIAYKNLGACYHETSAYEQALPYLEKALDIQLKVLGKLHFETGHSYNNLGGWHYYNDNFDKAFMYYTESLNIYLSIFEKPNVLTAESYHNIGYCHSSRGELREAIQHFEKALDIQIQAIGERHPRTATFYNSIGAYYKSIDKHNQALFYYQKGIQSLFSNYQESNVYCNPILKEYSNPKFLLNILTAKAVVFFQLYHQTHQVKDLQAAYQTLQLATQLLTQMRQSYKNEATQLLLAKNNSEVFEETIQVSLELSKTSDIPKERQTAQHFTFAACEQSKALLLLSTFKELEAKAAAGIPPALLEQEKQLKIELNYLEKSIAQQKAQAKKDEAFILELQSQFFDYKQQYDQLIEQFEQEYPDYFQLKYDEKTVTIDELQSQLTDEQVMVSYFIGEEKYYLFVITEDEFEIQAFDKPENFESTIHNFLKTIQQHNQANYIQTAHQLYKWLIRPIADYLLDPFGFGDAPKKLIIIPHGELHYLPFEALLATLPKTVSSSAPLAPYTTLDYLLRHCEISYHYSATLWAYLQNQRGQAAPANTTEAPYFTAYAPIYEQPNDQQQQAAQSYQGWASRSEAFRSDGSWLALPYSKKEAEQIATLFKKNGYPTATFLHEKANKTTFLKTVEQSRYILIASHGLVNDEQPKLSGLVFYPSEKVPTEQKSAATDEERSNSPSPDLTHSTNTDCILTLEDTYGLQLQADLVVLSSCESGIGQLAQGEGMMAVNRGFLYAGAKNVVYTLFKVLDKPSSDLTQAMFAHILKKESVGAALRKAKLELIQQADIDPKSWCGFVLLGE